MSGHEQRFAKGEYIIREGTRGDRAFLLKSGLVLICREDRNGKIIPIEKLGPGELFGEMSLLGGKDTLRNATAVALSEVITDVFFEDAIAQDYAKTSPLMKVILKGLTQRLVKMTDHYTRHQDKAVPSEEGTPPLPGQDDSGTEHYHL